MVEVAEVDVEHVFKVGYNLLNICLLYTSPKCGSGRILFYPKVAKCSNVDCTLTIFRNKCDKQLSDKQIVEPVSYTHLLGREVEVIVTFSRLQVIQPFVRLWISSLTDKEIGRAHV